jgi:hypothetical protein
MGKNKDKEEADSTNAPRKKGKKKLAVVDAPEHSVTATEPKQESALAKPDTRTDGQKLWREEPNAIVDFRESPLAKQIGVSDANTCRLIQRIANREGRPQDVGGLLNDMVKCYIKENYPTWELSYEKPSRGEPKDEPEPAGGIFDDPSRGRGLFG